MRHSIPTIRKTYLLLLLMASALALEAQNLVVSSPFAASMTRNEAVVHPRVDFNHDTCALVIVTLDFEDIDFEGDIKVIRYRDGEWWLYLSPGANWLTVLSDKHLPLRIEFPPVRPATTYTLGLTAPVVLQELTVTSPLTADLTMLDASRFRRNDEQERPCALLRVGLVLSKAEFVGAVDAEYRRGEWWVWMPAGSRSLTINAEGFLPLALTFDPLKSLVTYVMTIHQGKAEEVATAPTPAPKPEPKAEPKAEPRPAPKAEPVVVVPQEYAVSGVVTDKKGKAPLADAVVNLKQGDSVVVSGLTNALGQYNFTLLAGDYTVEVSHSDYEPFASKKPFAVKGATTVDAVRMKAVEKKPEPVVKAPKEPKAEGGWSWAAALESAVVPGLGQCLKGRWGSGVATFLGEAALGGGILTTYLLAEKEIETFTAPDGSLYEYALDENKYNAYRKLNIGFFGVLAAVHVYNIIRAGTMQPAKKSSLALAPSVMPIMGSLTPSLNLTFTF